MSQALMASTKWGGMVVLAVLVLCVFAGRPAHADPCAIACRSQHNACRMAAKLLFSPRCDAQLQACISECFAAGRFNRAPRDEARPGDFRDRRRPPPEVRGPPEDVPHERGAPREFREFRGDRGPRWLGGPRRFFGRF